MIDTEQFFEPHVLHSTTENAVIGFGFGLEFVSDPNDALMFIQKD